MNKKYDNNNIIIASRAYFLQGVLAAMIGALRDEVAKVCATSEARIDEGWVLLHEATE
jgi:hypothetical protein